MWGRSAAEKNIIKYLNTDGSHSGEMDAALNIKTSDIIGGVTVRLPPSGHAVQMDWSIINHAKIRRSSVITLLTSDNFRTHLPFSPF